MDIPEKVFFNGERLSFKFNPYCSCNIEYTNTDAFIEKACSWLGNNLQGIVGGSIYIEDFRKYMKGE